MKDNKQCNICAKQFICNKEKCKPVLWHETRNFGEVERKIVDGKIFITR